MPKASVSKSFLIEVARLYYEHDFSQQQIANKLDVSRPSVSRFLRQAKAQGIVKIEIIDSDEHVNHLENELKNKFNLKKVIIVPNDNEESTVIKQRLGHSAAKYLDQFIKDDLILGVSWGSTMQEVVRHIFPKKVKNMKVVQLNGGISKAEYDTHASEIAPKIGLKYQALPFLLPLPAIVDQPDVKRAIVSDKNIARTLDLARQATVALFTIGSFGYESVLVKADYFENEEVDILLKKKAVGDICSRIITEAGEVCDQKLNDRTIGIELLELRQKPYSIAVAGGKEKLKAIYAGLLGGHFNVLITDEWVAGEILSLSIQRS